jgi:UDP-glucose-4-epimerase GalE
MHILVTGGAGFVGSHAVRLLAKRGHEVSIYDNLSTGYRQLVEGFRLIEADLSDGRMLGRALAGVDVVMHFAASAYVGESVINPRKYFENNIQNGLRLLNSAVDTGGQRIVFSSTCAVYGIPKELPITEDTPCRPVNPYGESKLFFERALQACDHSYGVKSVRLRYFNAAGAEDSEEIGELHVPETHLIPLALEAAAGLRPRLDIFGDDYPTPDGTCVRDYIHVTDLGMAHVQAVNYLQCNGNSVALNLGNGKGYSVKEVIGAVEAVTGHHVPVRVSARRAGDPPVLVASSKMAEQVLGWRPSRGLEAIIASAWRWMGSARRAHILSEDVAKPLMPRC